VEDWIIGSPASEKTTYKDATFTGKTAHIVCGNCEVPRAITAISFTHFKMHATSFKASIPVDMVAGLDDHGMQGYFSAIAGKKWKLVVNPGGPYWDVIRIKKMGKRN